MACGKASSLLVDCQQERQRGPVRREHPHRIQRFLTERWSPPILGLLRSLVAFGAQGDLKPPPALASPSRQLASLPLGGRSLRDDRASPIGREGLNHSIESGACPSQTRM